MGPIAAIWVRISQNILTYQHQLMEEQTRDPRCGTEININHGLDALSVKTKTKQVFTSISYQYYHLVAAYWDRGTDTHRLGAL